MDKTPVIIAAFNEERYIGGTLQALPAAEVEPIVAVNGSTDSTAEIARSFGATTLEFEDQGKLPAQQAALRYLGDRALEPVLFFGRRQLPKQQPLGFGNACCCGCFWSCRRFWLARLLGRQSPLRQIAVIPSYR